MALSRFRCRIATSLENPPRRLTQERGLALICRRVFGAVRVLSLGYATLWSNFFCWLTCWRFSVFPEWCLRTRYCGTAKNHESIDHLLPSVGLGRADVEASLAQELSVEDWACITSAVAKLPQVAALKIEGTCTASRWRSRTKVNLCLQLHP